MNYKEQKFEVVLKPHKCQIQLTKKKKFTASLQLNDSSKYTGSLTCLNRNLKYLFTLKVWSKRNKQTSIQTTNSYKTTCKRKQLVHKIKQTKYNYSDLTLK